MKAVIYRQYGGSEVLEFVEVPDPNFSEQCAHWDESRGS
jgi:NADPH:quinone reductase-like Zn-dependent oxidoreductase